MSGSYRLEAPGLRISAVGLQREAAASRVRPLVPWPRRRRFPSAGHSLPDAAILDVTGLVRVALEDDPLARSRSGGVMAVMAKAGTERMEARAA